MTVVPFKRPDAKETKPVSSRRSVGEFAGAMVMIGLAFFLLPTIWSTAPVHLLAVIHLLVAVVYFQQGPRVVAGIWIALTLVMLALVSTPSPVTYALSFGAAAFDAALVR